MQEIDDGDEAEFSAPDAIDFPTKAERKFGT